MTEAKLYVPKGILGRDLSLPEETQTSDMAISWVETMIRREELQKLTNFLADQGVTEDAVEFSLIEKDDLQGAVLVIGDRQFLVGENHDNEICLN